MLEQAFRERLRGLAPGTASQRYIVASLPATRIPFRSKRSSKSARLRPYRSRVCSTCSSLPHATTDAR